MEMEWMTSSPITGPASMLAEADAEALAEALAKALAEAVAKALAGAETEALTEVGGATDDTEVEAAEGDGS
jgi:hypothetical protein